MVGFTSVSNQKVRELRIFCIDLPDSLAAVKLEKLAHDQSLCKDTALWTGMYQTSDFDSEGFP